MISYRNILKMVMAGLIVAPAFTACSDSDDLTGLGELETEEQAFGKATGNFTAEEWFPGGELGTTEKASYSAPTPAVEQIAGMESDFMTGNDLFEHLYTFEQAPRRGLGKYSFLSSSLFSTANGIPPYCIYEYIASVAEPPTYP